MDFTNYTNNAQNIQVVAAFTDVTPTLLLKAGEGDLLPETNGTVTIEMLDNSLNVIKREVIHYATRVGDLLTGLSRSVEPCVQNDTEDPRQRTQLVLDFTPGSGQLVNCSLRYTEGNDKDLKETITGDFLVKTTTDQTVNGVKTFTSSPQVPTPDSNNDAVNKQYVDEEIAEMGAVEKLTEKIYPLGEEVSINDSFFAEDMITFGQANVRMLVGDNSARTKIAIPFIGNGIGWTYTTISLQKHGSPSANFQIRIETDAGGVPSGTAYAGGTGGLGAGGVSTSVTEVSIPFDGFQTCVVPKGEKAWLVIFQDGNTVNASNYYSIGYIARKTTTRFARVSNLTVWSSFPTDNFVYLKANGIESTLLSKTSASNTYQLPTNGISRYATVSGNVGEIIPVTYKGEHNTFSGLVKGERYYLSNIPGAITTSPGTNSVEIGMAIESNVMLIASPVITVGQTFSTDVGGIITMNATSTDNNSSVVLDGTSIMQHNSNSLSSDRGGSVLATYIGKGDHTITNSGCTIANIRFIPNT